MTHSRSSHPSPGITTAGDSDSCSSGVLPVPSESRDRDRRRPGCTHLKMLRRPIQRRFKNQGRIRIRTALRPTGHRDAKWWPRGVARDTVWLVCIAQYTSRGFLTGPPSEARQPSVTASSSVSILGRLPGPRALAPAVICVPACVDDSERPRSGGES